MSCPIVLAASRDGCKTQGGISDIYLIDKSERTDDQVTFVNNNGACDITLVGAPVSAYHVILRQDSANLTTPGTDDNAAGTSFVTQTLEFNFRQYTAEYVYLNDQLRKGRVEVLVRFRSGTLVYLGIEEAGMQTGGGDAGFSGTAIGDGQGHTITLVGDSVLAAPVLADFSTFEAAFTIVEPT